MFSLGPNGLRGCADRIVQNAEQKSLDRSSSKIYRFNNNNRPDKTTTTIMSRSYINTLDTNYDYEDSNIATSIRHPVNQPSSSSNYYHTLSNNYRSVPIREETIRDSSLWDRTARDYNLRNSPIRDYSSRDNTNRNSSIRDSRSSSRESESSVRENTVSENRQSPEYQTLVDD
jgi:hypothetical protein